MLLFFSIFLIHILPAPICLPSQLWKCPTWAGDCFISTGHEGSWQSQGDHFGQLLKSATNSKTSATGFWIKIDLDKENAIENKVNSLELIVFINITAFEFIVSLLNIAWIRMVNCLNFICFVSDFNYFNSPKTPPFKSSWVKDPAPNQHTVSLRNTYKENHLFLGKTKKPE